MDIIKTFENNNAGMHITIKGTHEEPLFRASDIAAILEMTNIRVMIKDFDNTEKGVSNAYTLGGEQEVTFLTEKGLYQVLFTSRKPIAKQFKNWVCEVIKEIRLNGRYQLEQQLKDTITLKEQNLLTNFSKKTINYLGYVDKEKKIVKYGWTDDGETRIENHKKDYKKDFTFEYIYESQYAREIERQITQHPSIKPRLIEREYNKKNRVELIQLDLEFTIKDVDKIIKKIKDQVESKEKDKNKNSEIDKLKLELLQEKEKYQKEIEKLKNEINEFKRKCNIKMVDYSCSICKYTTGNKSHILRHIKQTKCSEKEAKILEIDTVNQCEYCKKIYTSKSSLIKHTRLCKENKQIKIQKTKNNELRKQLFNKYFITNDNEIECIYCSWTTKRFYYAIYHKQKAIYDGLKYDCKSCIKLSDEENNDWKQLFISEEKDENTIL